MRRQGNTHGIKHKSIRIIALLLALPFCAACAVDNREEEFYPMGEVLSPAFSYWFVPQHIHNKPLPEGCETLRILAVGNSYTEDGLRQMAALMEDAGIEPERVAIYMTTIGGASLDRWAQVASRTQVMSLSHVYGTLPMRTRGIMIDLFAQDWDIVVLQQYSQYADNFNTYNPSLDYLATTIINNATNQDLALAWQLTWRHADWPMARYTATCEAVQTMIKTNGIDHIIPTGTAIENARQTSLNTDQMLTRDGTHLDKEVGCLIASLAWFETLVSPAFGVHIEDLPYCDSLPTLCVRAAMDYPYTISYIEESISTDANSDATE